MRSEKGEGRVTRECLLSDKVRRGYGDSADEQNRIMLELEEANRLAVGFLNSL